jgi:hypothetical protein
VSENSDAGQVVSRNDLAKLAELFDNSEHAFDPTSRQAKEAESAFDDLISQIYRDKVEKQFSSFPYAAFRAKIRSLCRVYIKKNSP